MATQVHMSKRPEYSSWMQLVDEAAREKELLDSTCKLYSTRHSKDTSVRDNKCLCGRRARRHSFKEEAQTNPPDTSGKWKYFKHAVEMPVDVYGVLQNGTKFVRWDHVRMPPREPSNATTTDTQTPDTSLPVIVRMILADVVDNKPNFLISCYGGAKYFKMSHKLEKKFMDGIGQAAATDGVWLLSTGLNSGVSKVIGQGIRRFNLLNEKPARHTLIGLSSWGCLSDRTHQVLRQQAKLSRNIDKESVDNGEYDDFIWTTLDENEPDTLESNHTHFLLLDDGTQGQYQKTETEIERSYIDDEPRSQLVGELKDKTDCDTVTIIVEGGMDSLEVIINDLKANRPVVLIHGSGRLATAIANLIELTRSMITVSTEEIELQFKSVIAVQPSKSLTEFSIEQIRFILEPKNRLYLSVFHLDDDTSLTDTIFLAVFTARMAQMNRETVRGASTLPKIGIKKMLDLAISWKYGDDVNDIFEKIEAVYYNQRWDPELFEKALKNNCPTFVDYFLRRQYNVLETEAYMEFLHKNKNKRQGFTDLLLTTTSLSKQQRGHDVIPQSDDHHNARFETTEKTTDEGKIAAVRAVFGHQFVIEKLYTDPASHIEEYDCVRTLSDLDNLYYHLIGHYADSFFYKRSNTDRIRMDFRSIRDDMDKIFKRSQKKASTFPSTAGIRPRLSQVNPLNFNISTILFATNPILPAPCEKTFGNQEMLRDIFLWTVITGHVELAFVLLLQLKTRIAAALVATGIARRLMLMNDEYLDRRHKFEKQAKDYEQFATACINACYKRNEQRACQLLLREIPLFGNITCMQVAISFRIESFINSRCFNQVLNRQWYGGLKRETRGPLGILPSIIISLVSLGSLAPQFLTYRKNKANKLEESTISADERKEDVQRRWKGVEDQYDDSMKYVDKVLHFHRIPLIRMCYEFCIYIWFLLAFSYMMLFEMSSENSSIHWTEIYVIVAISTMLIEDIRRMLVEYYLQMLERWHLADVWIVGVYVMPYVLFYIGIGLQFGSRNRPNLFTAARILLALDLELWFLFSLRFVSAVKLLGPKLFMIRNMLKDLIGFMYIIFVCIAAYGIVSRALIMYSNIEFHAKSIAEAIFYRPYWFLYSIADDEKNDLDMIIASNSSTTNQVVEATTTHVLLAFHMLFINILILNLLIAVFNFTVNDVQAKSEYLWRYQRYELIRIYFEKPPLAYPPLSLIGYLFPLMKWLLGRQDVFRALKRQAPPRLNTAWTEFENAATYSYTRTFVDRMYHSGSILTVPTFSEADELKADIEALKQRVNQMHALLDNLNAHSKQMAPAMDWMMKAMKRVKMHRKEPPLLMSTTTSDA